MRQDTQVAHQELWDQIKQIRCDCLAAMRFMHRLDLDHLSQNSFDETRKSRGLETILNSLQESRFHLGMVLEYMDVSGQDPYTRWKKTYEIREDINITEEADKPSIFPSPSGNAQYDLMELASEMEDREKELKITLRSLPHYYLDGWIYRHFEQAVMKISQARCNIRLCSAIVSDEKTHTGEVEERTEGNTHNILSSDTGFQASSRKRQL